MKHSDLKSQAEAVKRFFLSLPADVDGSLAELNGRKVARVLRVVDDGPCVSNAAGPWTEEKKIRRCALVEREIDGLLSPEEIAELEFLEREMLRERQRLAPIPLADLRRMHQDLMKKAQEQAEGHPL